MAAELGKGHYIEYRAGESVKCQSYCLCCGHCNYYHENVKINSENKPVTVIKTVADKSSEKIAA
jgi:C4-type Zn-finger protein